MMRSLPKINLTIKLVLPIIVLVFVIGLLGFLSHKKLNQLVGEYSVIAEDLLPSTRQAGEMYAHFQSVRIHSLVLGKPKYSGMFLISIT